MTTRFRRYLAITGAALAFVMAGHAGDARLIAAEPGPASWIDDLTPITGADWNYESAEHLLDRAGFSGTPEDIQHLPQ
ncbi:MAG: hypothetical protein OSB03_16855, partial [Vicinamibacterales bacterium]|nr:hypothetical protein [Vicinamibacterales bacterium]